MGEAGRYLLHVMGHEDDGRAVGVGGQITAKARPTISSVGTEPNSLLS